ncbi:RsbRD N-terminal domain-containing protein [Maridesulfovibrio frigidus]|uniref:RsbRD N-terminal domain-containing protein n=1 Tax=Maridesulfovibrio frigidus TaxID=340956 RepID=UPI0004E16417|nr:RsbRD N-terminal domain-containing protein [Maridesulfovibrio frigidus]
MNLEEMLLEKKEVLAAKWFDIVLSSYPEATQKIWKSNSDKFTNPVGITTQRVTKELFDLIIEWKDVDAIAKTIEDLIKIRAVQEFAPSRALSFVFLFKKLLRDEFMQVLKKEGRLDELLAFETRIDNLGLIAFDIYTKNRDLITQMRIEEVKRSHHMLLRRVNEIEDASAKGAGQV